MRRFLEIPFGPLSLLPSAGLVLWPILVACMASGARWNAAGQEAPAPGVTQAQLERMAAEISEQVAELRELEFLRPVTVKVADKASVARYATERMDAMDSPAERRAAERVAKLMGLLPPDVDLETLLVDFLNEQAGGFYDPGRDTFYLLEGVGADLARTVVSHEFVHALEDQHFDLSAILEGRRDNSDQAAAAHAVLEGSALSIQNAWMLQHLSLEQMGRAAEQAGEQSSQMFSAPLAVWKPLLCSYFQGLAFLRRSASPQVGQTRRLDIEDIDQAFAQLPRSTEQLLHPEKYWNPELRDEPTPVLIDPLAEEPIETVSGTKRRFVLQLADTQGEAGIALLFDSEVVSPGVDVAALLARIQFTNSAASGWDGDRLALFQVEDGGDYLFWTSVWDSPAEAEEFARALLALEPRFLGAARALGGAEPGVSVDREGARVRFQLWSAPSARPRDPSVLLRERIGEAPAEESAKQTGR